MITFPKQLTIYRFYESGIQKPQAYSVRRPPLRKILDVFLTKRKADETAGVVTELNGFLAIIFFWPPILI